MQLGGVPLIARAVQVALRARKIDAVFVSSDDPMILDCARRSGAQTILRPLSLSDDVATSESALLHALDDPGVAAFAPAILVMMQCTSPFVRSDDIDTLIGALGDIRFDCALTVVEDHCFLWGRDEGGIGTGINHDPGKERQRRQDAPAQYRETGEAYAMRTEAFRATRRRFCGNTALVVTAHPPLEIDALTDLEFARALESVSPEKAFADPRLARVDALITDFDGVHTDDRVRVDEEGHESVLCSRSDGFGVESLRMAGIPVLILSRESSSVVAARATKLQVEVIQGEHDKLSALSTWCESGGILPEQLCFLGNDVSDIECMERAGLAAAPSDAHPSVRRVADIILKRPGGKGAVREIADMILAVRSHRLSG